MTRDFSGKVVIVTGSSSGIGEGTAILFSKAGANVVVTGRSRENVARVAQQCQSVSPKKLKPLEVMADITNDEQSKNIIEATVAEFGKIDVLVNNAGSGWYHNFMDENFMDVYEKTMRIDLRSVVYLSHLAVPHLEKTKGNIVNISSGAARQPMAQSTAYCMAKAGVDMFTRCLAVELGPKGIRVNSIDSGVVITNFLNNSGINQTMDEVKAWATSASPIGKVGEPVDIANSVVFLASDEASFITGINMLVAGGVVTG